jgi:hypothetical protein
MLFIRILSEMRWKNRDETTGTILDITAAFTLAHGSAVRRFRDYNALWEKTSPAAQYHDTLNTRRLSDDNPQRLI